MSILNGGSTIYKVSKNSKIEELIPSGMYELEYSMDEGTFLVKKDIVCDNIIDLPGSDSDKILQEVEQFSSDEVKTLFKEYGNVYKKGFLLYGKPGTGKSVTAISAARKLIEKKQAVVLFNPNPDMFKDFVKRFEDELKDRIVCVILEEFEAVYNDDPTRILSILDGEAQCNNLVTIACTNYIERLPERIKSRPSRFSTILEIMPPSPEVRRAFISGKLIERDMDKLETIVDSTEGFTLDQVKEVISSVFVFKTPLPDVIAKINTMRDNSIGEENIQQYHTNQYIKDLVAILPSTSSNPFKRK